MRSKKVTQLFAGLLVTAMVVTGTVIPSTTAQAKAKSVTIKTQKQLDAALKDPKVTSITIKTSKGIDLKIKTGDYGKKNLVINAPKATVNNYGNFKKISIQDGKTVYDRGKANNIAVSDKNSLKLYAGKQSKDTDITITSKGSKITIVNNGSVDSINVKGKSSVTVGGSAKEAPTITNNASGSKIVTTMDAAVVLNKSASLTVKSGATLDSLTMKADATVTVSAGTTVNELIIDKADANVDLKINGTVGKVIVDQKATINVSGTTTDTITVENNASGSEINSAVKTDVSLNADAKISLEKGAEGSTVKAESADVKPTVENKTDEKVTVTDSTGKDSTIDAGKTDADAKPSTDNTNQGSTSGGSTGGGSTGGDPYYPPSDNGGTVVEKSYMDVSVTKLAKAPADGNKIFSQKNQDAITVTQEKVAGTLEVKVSGNLSKMEKFTSTNKDQVGEVYWIGLVVNTGESDITKVKIGGNALTKDDVAEASTIGLSAGSFILWLRAEEVETEVRTLVLSTDGKQSVTVTISFEDTMTVDALYEAVEKAGKYEYGSDPNYMGSEGITVEGAVVTADFSKDKEADTKIRKAYNGLKGDDQSKMEAEKQQLSVNTYVLYTFARYAGALHRYNESSGEYLVSKIVFDGKDYKWNDKGTLSGSNWKCDEGASLVRDVKYACMMNADEQTSLSQIKDITFDLVGADGKKITVTFKVKNVPPYPTSVETPENEGISSNSVEEAASES